MTYLEILEKIQAQTLDNVKQIEAASLPSLMKLPNGPTIEGLPTLAQVVELNSSFATQVLDQQKAFASQLAEVFSPAVNSSSNLVAGAAR
jgi:hypothetical protein